MKTEVININDELDILLNSEKKDYIIRTRHFFFDVIEHFSKSLNTDEKIEMLYYFSIVEKTLKLCRNRQFSLAKYWIDYLDNYKTELPIEAQNGLKVSYYPMLAFYYYAQKDFENARIELNKCFPSIELLQSNDVSEILVTKIEQRLNLIRLIKFIENEEAVFDEINGLLQFVFLEIDTDFLTGDLSKIFTNEEIKISNMKFYFDASVKVIFKNLSIENELEKENLSKLFNSILTNSNAAINEIEVYKLAVEAVKNYIENKNYEFLDNIKKCLPQFQKLPNILQFILLERVKKIADLLKLDDVYLMEEKIKSYYLNFLPNFNNNTTTQIRETLKYVRA